MPGTAAALALDAAINAQLAKHRDITHHGFKTCNRLVTTFDLQQLTESAKQQGASAHSRLLGSFSAS
jgi:hypothetical protein